MVKVLNVVSGLNHAGTEAVIMNYYRNIDRTKIQFDFLVLNLGTGYYEVEIKRMGGKIYKIPSFRQNPLKNLSAKKKFFKKHAKEYDAVEVHSPSALRYAYCKLAKKYGAKKVIFHIHSSSDQKGILIKHARRQIKKYCDETVTCSQRAAVSVLGEKADRIVYNAIDGSEYCFNAQFRNKIRNHYGIADGQKVIGQVGRYSIVKNHLFSLKAFADAAKRDSSLILLMKGFGELETEIAATIKALGLTGKAIMAGDEFEASQLYSAFDLLILPSLYEGLPMVLVEAQANGLKALASDHVSNETNISGCVSFLELDAKKWSDAFLKKDNFTRIPVGFDFARTNYNIAKEAEIRERDYLEAACEDEIH